MMSPGQYLATTSFLGPFFCALQHYSMAVTGTTMTLPHLTPSCGNEKGRTPWTTQRAPSQWEAEKFLDYDHVWPWARTHQVINGAPDRNHVWCFFKQWWETSTGDWDGIQGDFPGLSALLSLPGEWLFFCWISLNNSRTLWVKQIDFLANRNRLSESVCT